VATHAKRPRDPNQLAKLIVDISTESVEEKHASTKPSKGRAGGLKGGVVRAQRLTKKRRVEIAKKAAKTRWKALAEDN
jgi:hypothetical protein